MQSNVEQYHVLFIFIGLEFTKYITSEAFPIYASPLPRLLNVRGFIYTAVYALDPFPLCCFFLSMNQRFVMPFIR